MNTRQFKESVRSPYAWPGGYPLVWYTTDGGCLCRKCAKDNAKQIISAIRTKANDGWQVDGIDVNWESLEFCDNCGEQIESAYPPIEDEDK